MKNTVEKKVRLPMRKNGILKLKKEATIAKPNIIAVPT